MQLDNASKLQNNTATEQLSHADSQRQRLMHQWLRQHITPNQVTPLVQDASFRRYFRAHTADRTYIVMDSPPEKEACGGFVKIAKGLKQIQVNTPQIHAADTELGFVLLTDFGQQLYLDRLAPDNADQLYTRAMQELIKIQSCKQIAEFNIPEFNHAELSAELENFRAWYLQKYCKLTLTDTHHHTIDQLFDLLITSATTQPQVFTHRDYHSRNLMCLGNNAIGILDFQDALWGPITYDLVSMIRDCYVVWPNHKVEQWAEEFYQLLQQNGAVDYSFSQFMRWFDLMGLQRHLKAIFIFARKSLRDQDPRYLEDIPRGLHYVQLICSKYPELQAFKQLLCEFKIL